MFEKARTLKLTRTDGEDQQKGNDKPREAAKIPNYGGCGILSPLLANVCLNELDHMMEQKIVEFFRLCERDTIWKYSTDDGCHNPDWPEFVPSNGKDRTRKMDFIRYGGHFLVGIRGPRQDAVEMRKEIIEFCERILGVRCRDSASLQQCIRQFRKLKLVKGDKDPELLPCTPMLYSGQAHTNSQMNKFLETMADWFRYADNRRKVVGFCAIGKILNINIKSILMEDEGEEPQQVNHNTAFTAQQINHGKQNNHRDRGNSYRGRGNMNYNSRSGSFRAFGQSSNQQPIQNTANPSKEKHDYIACKLSDLRPYKGSDKIVVGNRNGLIITHIDSGSVSGLKLKEVLVVPQLKKKLLSVSKLNKYNYCTIQFDVLTSDVKDKKTGKQLAKRSRRGDIYVLEGNNPLALTTAQTGGGVLVLLMFGMPGLAFKF
ncbi:putative flavin-containing monooxygenase 1-like [Capsicum annuum]|nr:putative flavin-containing monooxygenase 1-like [Capsicum annuum]